MSIRGVPKKRLIYLCLIIVLFLVIWGIWSANRISQNVDRLVVQDELNAAKKTTVYLRTINMGFGSKQDDQNATSYMLTQLDYELRNTKSYPLHDFNDSLSVQVVDQYRIKAEFSWSYKIDRLGWPLMTANNSNLVNSTR